MTLDQTWTLAQRAKSAISSSLDLGDVGDLSPFHPSSTSAESHILDLTLLPCLSGYKVSMGSENVTETAEDGDQVVDFVTLGMFIIGMPPSFQSVSYFYLECDSPVLKLQRVLIAS